MPVLKLTDKQFKQLVEKGVSTVQEVEGANSSEWLSKIKGTQDIPSGLTGNVNAEFWRKKFPQISSAEIQAAAKAAMNREDKKRTIIDVVGQSAKTFALIGVERMLETEPDPVEPEVEEPEPPEIVESESPVE